MIIHGNRLKHYSGAKKLLQTTFVILLAGLNLQLSCCARAQPQTTSNTCTDNCSGRGNCNLDTKSCDCPWGYGGRDCSQELLPSCRAAPGATDLTCDLNQRRPQNCACLRQCRRYLCDAKSGVCNFPFDIDIARPCFTQRGVSDEHQYSGVPAENDTQYAWYSGPDSLDEVEPDEVLQWHDHSAVKLSRCPSQCRQRGWCMRPLQRPGQLQQPGRCGCFLGYEGQTCGQVDKAVCLNNCSGKGTCVGGFCHCVEGRWGRDCSRTKAVDMQRPEEWPMLRGGATGDKLKVYIYEVPLHIAGRLFGAYDPIYNAADVFSELLYQDWQVRTQNPWEASLFFLPALNFFYSTNVGKANSHMRVLLDWARTTYPFWNATGGKDHFFWILGDRNNCYLDEVEIPGITAPIRLTHFGYHARNSSLFSWLPDKSVGCFDPLRDVAAAPYHEEDAGSVMDDPRYRAWIREYHTWRTKLAGGAPPASFAASFGAGFHPHAAHEHSIPGLHDAHSLASVANFSSKTDAERDILLLFAGGIRREDPEYSGGARAALIDVTKDLKDPEVAVYDGAAPESYFDLMWRAKYCFVAYGHGWGIRLRLVVARGCVPVIVQDSVVQYFEDLLPYPHFSLRFRQADMPVLVQRLRAIPPAHLKLLQVGLRRYHRVFFWNPRAPVHGLAYNYTILSLRHRLRNHVAGYYRHL